LAAIFILSEAHPPSTVPANEAGTHKLNQSDSPSQEPGVRLKTDSTKGRETGGMEGERKHKRKE
jgi:hypothetical protein